MGIRKFLAIIFSIGVLAFPVIMTGPLLLRDMSVAKWQPAPATTDTSGHCTTQMLIVSFCSVSYTLNGEKTTLEYCVYGFYSLFGRESFDLVQAVGNLAHISASFAVRDLVARQITMIVWLLINFSFYGMLIMRLMSERGASSADSAPSAIVPRADRGAPRAFGKRV